MNSIKYYNDNPKVFIDSTMNVDMTCLYRHFEKYLNSDDHILDLGCGSGRDSLYFSSKGFEVTSIDGSTEMINHCKSVLDNKVILSTFEAFESTEKYNAIWACASLLHVPEENLKGIVQKYIGLLEDRGIFFMSFKDRPEHFEKDGRYFTCFNKSGLGNFIETLNDIVVIEYIETVDARKVKEAEKWISVILRKV